MKKRIMSLFLCLCMLITLLPTTAFTARGDSLSTTTRTAGEKAENPFTDVKESDWFYSAVQYAREKGFFSGTSATTFEPNRTMTRGMFVTVLGRMAGVDTADYKGESTFSDVEADAYYAPYVAWAAKHGITTGVGEGKFAPDELINRQQMAVFFVRYFESFGVDYDTGTKISTTPADIDKVDGYARDAVLKLWRTGLLAGDGVNFDPLGNASRAQAATLCMRIDGTVKTWYKEPGVAKEEKPVVIPPSDDSSSEDESSENSSSDDKSSNDKSSGGKSSGGRSSGGGSSGGGSTVYYKVTLTAGEESASKLYSAGTLLSTMPVPVQENGKVFLGWYYDSALSSMVTSTETLSGDLILYAKFAEAVSLAEKDQLNFVTRQDVDENFTIRMKADSIPVSGKDFIFRNITDPSVTNGADGVEQERVSVTGSAGSFTVASANGGFTPGHTYQIELLNDEVTFAGEGEEVRYYNFIIKKDEVMKLELSNGIKYIPADALSETDRKNVLEYAGLYKAVTDAKGETSYTTNSGTGSFTYSGDGIMVGDTIAVYTGKEPDKRTVKDSGTVAYVKITRIDGTTYYYQSAQAEEVLFTPDLLPIDLDKGDGVEEGNTVVTNGSGSITISTSKLDFSDAKYADMGLSADTVVESGDYLSFFNNGDFGDADASKQGYGLITGITRNGEYTIITYVAVSEKDVMSAMELYSESELTEEEIDVAYDEQLIREAVESQLMSSGFIQEAGEYLAGLAIQTDEIKEIFGSEDDLTLSDYIITYSDGTPVSQHDLALMGNIVDKEGGIDISVSVSPRLVHFEGKPGVRAEVAVKYSFDIQKKGSDKKVEVELTAFFEQELVFGFSVSGGAVWKKKWIFPYIADYRMTGNIDLGTYTGVGITATAKLADDEEPMGMSWPKKSKEALAAQDIINLSESIKKKMKAVKTVLPEDEGSASGDLAEKYADFMEDANEEWIDLFVVNLIDLRGAVDPLHILAYGIQVDFVVSANLNVALGLTFQYENSKRHSFTLTLKSKTAERDSIDLSTNGYQFDLYVMGTLGMRAGVRAKVLMGLFSTKLDGIGLQIEAGAYVRLWGYFYYSVTNYQVEGVWEKNSSASGAMLVEIGAYLDVKFVAEVLNGKYSYAPTIYAEEWPFWSAGQRENVYDFAYEEAPTFNIQNVTTYTLPSTIFDMKWMDLKTGDIGDDDDPSIKNFDDTTVHNNKDEKYFAVELSNPVFTYNPANNQITISRDSGESDLTCEMKLTWKGAPLAFSTETLSRTITLKWNDVVNGKTIVFETNGGSPVDMICKLAGANISALKPANPTRTGYAFGGWYTNSDFTGTAYTIPDTMPNENLTLYAKWIPDKASYTVEHYQKGLDGMYVLAERQTMSGVTNQDTDAQAISYEGFTPKAIQQKTILPDSSTVVQVYYERNSYTVTFNYGEEAGNRSVAIKYPMGAKIEWSSPTTPGYTFLGWDETVPEFMPTRDLTFTASWSARTDTIYTVEHYQENSNNSNSGYTLVEREILEGKTGSSVPPDVKTYEGFAVPATQSVVIKADGSAVVRYYYNRKSYTLTYVPGNGEDNDVFTVKLGDLIPQRNDPVRAGYTFAGWKENDSAASVPTTMPARNVTLNAQWSVNQYTITFDSNGGSYVSPITQEYGTTVTEPTPPSRTGYTFAGWKLNDFYYTFSTMPAENITLIAEWIADGDILYKVEHYQEELDGNYPSIPSYMENLYDSTGSTVTANAKNFTGFTYDPAASGTVSSGTVAADGSLVLKLYYTRNSYNVEWDSNGVSVDTSGATTGNVKYGTTIIKPANNPTRAGYTFNGWSGYSENMTMPAGNITFTAKWTANQYTISFDGNGGTVGTSSKVVSAGSAYGELPVPTYDGQYFLGWFTSANGGTRVISASDVEIFADHTLYAHWTEAFTGEVDESVELYVAGKKVTTENMNDVLGDGSGSVKFDPSTLNITAGMIYNAGTLYLNNATIEGFSRVTFKSNEINAAIFCNGGLTIVNEGTSTVTNSCYAASTETQVYGLYTYDTLNFYGTGTLTFTSGTGGTQYNCGIRAAARGGYFYIGKSTNDADGPIVKAFAGIAGSGGKSYGVGIGEFTEHYVITLKKGAIEAHGHDCAAFTSSKDGVKYIVKQGSELQSGTTKYETITASENYDGSSATEVPCDQYRKYKYIYVENL